MKTNKKDIDQLIKESLDQEQTEFYKTLEKDGLWEDLKGIYKGLRGWLAVIMLLVNFIVIAIAAYTGYKFFTISNEEEFLKYGAVMFLALLFGTMIKLWYWMQMDKNAIIREVRRLEFQVAVLMEQSGPNRK